MTFKFVQLWISMIVVISITVHINAVKPSVTTFSSKNAVSGNFSTTNYPKPYPSNTKCTFRFINHMKWLIIEFLDFDLYNDNTSVTRNAEKSSLVSYAITQVGGTRQVLTSENPFSFYTGDKDFHLEFHGGPYNDNHTGFFAAYTFTNNICDEVFESKHHSSGVLASLMYPRRYLENINCTYLFIGKSNENVQIVFEDFGLFKSSSNITGCENGDSMIVYKRYGKQVEICGDKNPLPIMSTGSNFTIVFSTTSIPADILVRGFKATYNFTKSYGITTGTLEPYSACSFAYNSSIEKTGYIYSPNFPGWYPKGIQCTYYFIGASLESVLLNFTTFNLPSDGGSCSSSTFNDYVSFSDQENNPSVGYVYCGSLNEFEVRSNGSNPLVIFMGREDRYDPSTSDMYIGFMATYEFVHAICEHNFTSSTGKSGYVTSPSYPVTYPDGIRCDYYFTGEAEESVLLNFTNFHLPGGESCSSVHGDDYVSFLETGNNEQVFCGDHISLIIQSHGSSSVQLSFKGGDNLLGDNFGFEFTYYFIKKADSGSLALKFGVTMTTTIFWTFCFFHIFLRLILTEN